MTLAKRIHDQLELAPLHQKSEIRAHDDRIRVELSIADCGRLGCLLNRLELRQNMGQPLIMNPSLISERVTYLGERLELIEREGKEGSAVLRSSPPRKDGVVISFFEMILHGNKVLTLSRYEYDPDEGERTSVPATLTHETLKRLVNDLINLAGS